jgi:HSP20 family protein
MAEKALERRRDPFDWWPEVFPRRFMEWFDTSARGEHVMRVEEALDGKDLVIRAEMPGIDPDKDVQIELRDHLLELRAQRKQKAEQEEKGVRRSEFHYGSFYRAIPLPLDATEADVRATYKDGILEVRVPCERKQEEPTKIQVTRP